MNKETINTFKDNKGIEWIQCHADQISGDSSVGSKVIAFDGYFEPKTDGYDCSLYGKIQLADIVNKDFSILIEKSKVELVTEHVEATAMDALQALVASGGKPVEGWEFCDDVVKSPRVREPLRGVDAWSKSLVFMSDVDGDCSWYDRAFRPVTRVRIKAEEKPKPKFKVGDLVEYKGIACHYVGRVEKVYNGASPQYNIQGINNFGWASDEASLSPWTPGYGFTLEGNPVPPPPEGYEIVPEGEAIGSDAKFYHDGTGRWFKSFMGKDQTASPFGELRAYARRVVKGSPSAQTVEHAFSQYWQGGSEKRAIDAFRAGVAWVKGVQGE